MAEVLPLRAYHHLVGLAAGDIGSVTVFSQVVLYILSGCLRFVHAQRHCFVHERCNERTLVGLVFKGKVRNGAAFWVGVPTHIAPDTPLLRSAYMRLKAIDATARFLMPDFGVQGQGGIIPQSPLFFISR